MAKELPFFKFEPSQWENGTIQICSFEEQGVFINLCSMYWQRLGDLPYKLAVQKVCAGNATALESLCEANVIKLIDGMICIDFLNEQLAEFGNLSKVNSENARLGWEKRRKYATAKRPQSDRNAIREEKKREEEIREEENTPFEDKFLRAFDEITCERLKMTFKEIPDLGRELQLFRTKCDNAPEDYHKRDISGLRLAFQYQLKNYKHGKGKRQTTPESLRAAVDKVIREQGIS